MRTQTNQKKQRLDKRINIQLVEDYIISEGISAEELARRTGLHPQTVRRAIRGYPVTPRTLKKLAEEIGVAPKDLIAEEE